MDRARKILTSLLLLTGLAFGQTQNVTGWDAWMNRAKAANITKINPESRVDTVSIFDRLDNSEVIQLQDYGIAVRDSNASETNGTIFKQVVDSALAQGKIIKLPKDTVWVDSMLFDDVDGLAIVGPGVLAYRSSVKDHNYNEMLSFKNTQDLIIRDITFIGNQDTSWATGASSGPGYKNAVLPITFIKGAEPNSNIYLSNLTIRDAWAIFASDKNSSTLFNTYDTVLTDFLFDRITWDQMPKTKIAESNGNLGLSLGSSFTMRGTIQNCYLNGMRENGIIYGEGFCRLGIGYDITVFNNRVYNTFDSQYYGQGSHYKWINNYAENSGKDNFKNIYNPLFTEWEPDSVGYNVWYGNTAMGSGWFVAGSPMGYNVEGVRNIVAHNRYIAQDTTGYITAQAQIGIRTRGRDNVIMNNVLYGKNDVLPGQPGSYGILVVDSVHTKGYTIIKDNIIEDFREGLFIQYDPNFVLVDDNFFWSIDSIGLQSASGAENYLVVRNNIFEGPREVFRISRADTVVFINNLAFNSQNLWGIGQGAPYASGSQSDYAILDGNHRMGDTYWEYTSQIRNQFGGTDSLRFVTPSDTLIPRRQK